MAKAKINTIADALLTIRRHEIQAPHTSRQATPRPNLIVVGFVEVAYRRESRIGDLSLMTRVWTAWAFSNLSSAIWIGMTHNRQKS
jgi:hypothetical protein